MDWEAEKKASYEDQAHAAQNMFDYQKACFLREATAQIKLAAVSLPAIGKASPVTKCCDAAWNGPAHFLPPIISAWSFRYRMNAKVDLRPSR